MIFLSKSPSETQKLGADFAKTLNRAVPIQIDLIGEIGAGKTTFVQGMAKGLGLPATVSSPTFTLVHQYDFLVHVDLYRIDRPADLKTLGLEDYLAPGNILVIEWGDKGEDFKIGKKIEIRFEFVSGSERKIEIDLPDLPNNLRP